MNEPPSLGAAQRAFGHESGHGTSAPVASASTGTDDLAWSDVRPPVPSIHIPSVHRCERGIGPVCDELERFLRINRRFIGAASRPPFVLAGQASPNPAVARTTPSVPSGATPWHKAGPRA